MNAFFPVGSTSVAATTSALSGTAIPTGGPMMRVARETSASRVFIKFGTSSSVAATVSDMELVSGVVEELENPGGYSHFSVITDTGICGVNIACGPRYNV